MHFEYWYQGILFIFIFFVIIAIPCVGVALIGYEMISKMGNEPSKTPNIQMSIFLKLMLIEIMSFLGIITFYHIFSAANP